MTPLVGLTEATNRNTPCHWVTVLGVSVLFSYETAMAFACPGKGAFRRKETVSRTTRKHMRETGVFNFDELDGEEFERKLNEAILHRVVADRELMQLVVSEAVANKLAPEAV